MEGLDFHRPDSKLDRAHLEINHSTVTVKDEQEGYIFSLLKYAVINVANSTMTVDCKEGGAFIFFNGGVANIKNSKIDAIKAYFIYKSKFIIYQYEKDISHLNIDGGRIKGDKGIYNLIRREKDRFNSNFELFAKKNNFLFGRSVLKNDWSIADVKMENNSFWSINGNTQVTNFLNDKSFL